MALYSGIEGIRNELKWGRHMNESAVSKEIILIFFKEAESFGPFTIAFAGRGNYRPELNRHILHHA